MPDHIPSPWGTPMNKTNPCSHGAYLVGGGGAGFVMGEGEETINITKRKLIDGVRATVKIQSREMEHVAMWSGCASLRRYSKT